MARPGRVSVKVVGEEGEGEEVVEEEVEVEEVVVVVVPGI